MRGYSAIKEPKTYTVTIEKMGMFGEGVAKVEDGVIFVPFAGVGETCEVEAVERRKHFINGRKIKTISLGPNAAEPECEYFGECGGCQLQHIDYPEQVNQKQQILEHFVRNKLESDCPIEVFASPKQYGYRRRVRLRQNQGEVGFFKNRSLSFIPVKECPVAVDDINDWLNDDTNFPRPETNHDISIDYREGQGVTTYQGSEQNLMGFQQVNAWGEGLLQELIEQESQPVLDKGILELYCGAGGLVLSWFKPTPEQAYFGIDNDGANIREGMARHQSDNIHFEVGHLPEWLSKKQQETPEFIDAFDVMVLDPARGGVGKSLKKLKPMPSFKKWIYVSCNPVSWYKDLKTLQAKHGLKLERVAMIDMFPQTRHFEVFSVLVPKA